CAYLPPIRRPLSQLIRGPKTRGQVTAATAGVLFDETATFDVIHHKSVFRWLDEQAARRKLKDEDDEDYDEDLPELAPPSPVELIARTLSAPKNQKHNFNDYLRSWEDGVWLRWTFERMCRRQPNGKILKPYMDADAYMEEHNVKMGRGLYERWIEWSAGRDLTPYEAEMLAQVWDKFIPIHNALESRGDPEPVHGIHDHVDDVHLLTVEGDPRYKDPNCLVFWHNDFRAVVIPERPMTFWSINMGAIVKLYPVGTIKVSGFVAPALPRDIWRRPFLPWLKGTAQRRDTALRTFITNPNKRFPTTEKRERQEGDGLTHVHINLSCPDENGWF
ncbi:MAG: hypothetical protein K2Y40_18520, partial [Reyranella sp.]|nr:hypothetical protein [Reyranella sp.]